MLCRADWRAGVGRIEGVADVRFAAGQAVGEVRDQRLAQQGTHQGRRREERPVALALLRGHDAFEYAAEHLRRDAPIELVVVEGDFGPEHQLLHGTPPELDGKVHCQALLEWMRFEQSAIQERNAAEAPCEAGARGDRPVQRPEEERRQQLSLGIATVRQAVLETMREEIEIAVEPSLALDEAQEEESGELEQRPGVARLCRDPRRKPCDGIVEQVAHRGEGPSPGGIDVERLGTAERRVERPSLTTRHQPREAAQRQRIVVAWCNRDDAHRLDGDRDEAGAAGRMVGEEEAERAASGEQSRQSPALGAIGGATPAGQAGERADFEQRLVGGGNREDAGRATKSVDERRVSGSGGEGAHAAMMAAAYLATRHA